MLSNMNLRNYYINGELRFSLKDDPQITDIKNIVESFISSKDFQFECRYFNWKLKSWELAQDGESVNIFVSEKDNGKGQEQKEQ